jgi:hypothetical protein
MFLTAINVPGHICESAAVHSLGRHRVLHVQTQHNLAVYQPVRFCKIVLLQPQPAQLVALLAGPM